MKANVHLFRVRGIPVAVNWSWLFAIVLIVWSLGTSMLASTYPGLDGSTYLAMALAVAVLLFVAIVLHELAHGFRAHASGMRLRSVTLWVFGGVTRFENPFPSPLAEFKVAIAGPAASCALSAMCLASAWGLRSVGAPSGVIGVADYTGRLNILLVVFNLIPALPLDGGQALHAWLWRRRGDSATAAITAARAGAASGFLLAATGLLSVFSGDSTGGPGLLLLGWLLIHAAHAESTHALIEKAFRNTRVADVMVTHPVTVDPNITVATFLADLQGLRYGAYPVIENGRAVGLLTTRRAVALGVDERNCLVDEVMEPVENLPVVRAEMALVNALPALDEQPGRVMVLDDIGHLTGLLSSTDVLKRAELDRLDTLAESRPIRVGATVRIGLVAAIVIAAASFWHPPYVVIEPGGSFDISGDITITGRDTSRPTGRYLLTSVRLTRPSALRTLWAIMRNDREVLALGEVVPEGFRPETYDQWLKRSFIDSREYAAIAAAKAVGLDAGVTGNGAEIIGILPSSPAAGLVREGDVVTGVNGVSVAVVSDLQNVVAGRPAGTRFRLRIERAGRRSEISIRSVSLPDLSGGVGLGLFTQTHDPMSMLPFEITFHDRSDVAGSSAGLAYALAIADMLDVSDIAAGRSIAATGTIDGNGDIGPVGAVAEKAIAARHAGADVFVVPSEEISGVDTTGLELHGAETLVTALQALRGP